MPVFKAIVKRIRDWKKNAVGSEYTRYFNSAEDMAKSMAGYTKYYGPEVARTLGWGSLTGVLGTIGAMDLSKAIVGKGARSKISGVSGLYLSAPAAGMTAAKTAASVEKIRKKAADLAAFKKQSGITSMSDVFKAQREAAKPTVEKSAKELVYNHFEK